MLHKTIVLTKNQSLSARSPALDLQTNTKPLCLTRKHSKCDLLAMPDAELLVSVLKSDDVVYNLYVGMVTFQPDSCRCILELQSVELQTGR